MESSTRRVGLVQMRCEASQEANLARALDGISQAAADGAQVVCLPELFRSLYLCQSEDPARFDWAEPIPGPSTEAISALEIGRASCRERVSSPV